MSRYAIHKIIVLILACFTYGIKVESQEITIFSLREDGTILKDGQPFFPMGFYVDRSWDTEVYKENIRQIAEGNDFNIVNLPFQADFENWPDFLDLCQEKGIYLVSQLAYSGDYLKQVRDFKNHPAMYGWSVADDADNGHFTIEELIQRNNAIKEIDTKHVTETSLTSYYESRRLAVDDYMDIADVSGFQSYPITPLPDYRAQVSAENALRESFKRGLHYVRSANKFKRPLIFNTQTFSWSDDSNSTPGEHRFPTVKEIRNMLYSSLAVGVKGIISYAFNDIYEQAEQWNEMIKLRDDVKVLEGAILNGSHNLIATNDDYLGCATWVYNGKVYVVVINTSYSDNKTISLQLPAGTYSNKTAVASRLPNTLSMNGSKLEGIINAEDVQVFVFDFEPEFTTDNSKYYIIRSHMTKPQWYLSNPAILDNGDQANYSEVEGYEKLAHWSIEDVGDYKVFKNRVTGDYLNVKNNQDYLESTSVSNTELSAHWTLLEKGEGYYQIKRRTNVFDYININDLKGYVEYVNGEDGWWTSEWRLEEVVDFKAPAVPTNIIASAISENSITIDWDVPYDEYGVVSYNVYLDGSDFTNVNKAACTVTGLSCSTTYSLSIAAIDAAGNISSRSIETSIPTSSCGTGIFSKKQKNDLYKIYPNPCEVQGSLNISSTINDLANLMVFDMSNQLIFDQEFRQNCKIEFEGIIPGIYLVAIETENTITSKKIIIK